MIQEQDQSDAQIEEARKEFKSKVMAEAGMKVKQPAKNPRKNNNKKANNAEPVSETVDTAGQVMETG